MNPLDLPFTIEPSWKQHLCYEALNTPVLDPDHLDPADPEYGPLTVEVFFGGGADGGKSWQICESRLVNAYKYPGYKSFIGRNELKRLMQTTYVTWQKVCKFHQIPQDEWRLDGQLHVIRFLNGSTIDLIDLAYKPSEDPLYERYGSAEYSDGALEECGEIHPLAREVLKSRCGRWMNDELGINPSLLETGNPKKNWTYHLFYKPSAKGELPIDRKFIQALHADNPRGQRAYGKNLDRITDPVMRARLRDGNWEYEDDPATLIHYPSIVDMFSNHIEDDDDESSAIRYMVVDAARLGGDKIVATLWRGWSCYKILYKVKQETTITEAWVDGLAYENDIPRSHVIVDEDGLGGGIVDHLKGVRGFQANSRPVEIEADEEEDKDNPEEKMVYSNLKTQCAYYLADKINSHNVAVHCEDVQIREWLTSELEQIKEENIDTEDKRQLVPKETVKIILNRSPDFGDCFIMRAFFDLKPPVKKAQTWTYRHKAQRQQRP